MTEMSYKDTGLPIFKYHQDPIRSGVIEQSDTTCICCGLARGYIYTGAVYGEHDIDERLCPWCIADGNAQKKFDASYTDLDGIGGYGTWEPVSKSVIDEVGYRTPSFTAWQQEQWWTHCGDAAQFIDYAGREELEGYGVECIDRVKKSAQVDPEQWDHIFQGLNKEGNVIAYVFRCLKCGAYGGYWDCW
jgi:uncharacterized protein